MKCARMISRFIGTSLILSLFTTQAWAQNYEEVIHYHSDALGSPVAATDANGDLLWSEEYAPYGSRLLHESRETDCSQGSSCLPVESIWDEKQWYTSKYEETRVGIQYYGARWYEPEIGRFLSIDPADFDIDNVFSFNRYAYANNNPYRYIDPDGRIAETPWDVFNIGLGVTSFVFNLSTGNIPGAVVDAVGVVADTVATIVPGLPGGAGATIKASRLADAASGVAKGGAYGKVKGIPGNEAHHMPADSVSPLSKNKGPAISMDAADHRQTASWGNSREARAYRRQQKQLIDQGDFRGAQQMDINDVRSKFGGKYDGPIRQMQDYTKKVDQ